jgi:oxygen-independent coproporphyrinogen-3 oxidase
MLVFHELQCNIRIKSGKPMAGIYIHIPFCKKACHYCNFHFSTSLKLKNDFLQALLNEMDLRVSYLNGESVSTIYFGGGTPSLLSQQETKTILDKIRQVFNVLPNAEITLEANPDDISEEKLVAWKNAGVNRLSIGVQSFFEEDLQWMNRAHTAAQSISNLQLAKNHFENITIDLIYGMQTLSDERWKQNVEHAIQLHIPHLSCYALTVEPKTALHTLINQHKLPDIDTNDQARQFLLLMEWMTSAGYDHYEISNFALPGKRSQHNSSYWQGANYLGLGPSAHSYNGSSRQWNIANNALYIQFLQNNQLNFEKEELTQTQQLNEYIMTSLRTSEGLDTDYISKQFSKEEAFRIQQSSDNLIKQELLQKKESNLILTRQGKLFADGIAAGLFGEEEAASS